MKQTTSYLKNSKPALEANKNDDVITKFQDLMSQFLEIQKTVMLAYINGKDNVSPSAGIKTSSPEYSKSYQVQPNMGEQLWNEINSTLTMADTIETDTAMAHQPEPMPMKMADPAPVVSEPISEKPQINIQTILLRIVGDRTGYPEDMLSMDLEIEADLGIDSIKRMQIMEEVESELDALKLSITDADREALVSSRTLGDILARMQELLGRAVSNTSSAPAAEVTQAAPQIDIQSILLGIVGDRTGYPEDMLSMDLEIEADLGIDSIKRMQIMEEVESELDALKLSITDADREALVSSRTLGDILAKMQVLLGSATSSTSSAPVAEAKQAAPQIDIQSILLRIVGDRTGYPEDMLSLDLEIEADLGIDSIKRMQIMEEVEARLDALQLSITDADREALVSSRTLGDILSKMQELIGGSQQAQAKPQVQPASSATSSVNVEALLRKIVSDLSGYPEDMLDLDLEIEADLGIDSIKRMQIMEHLEASLDKNQATPSESDLEKLAQSVTLGDIVTHLETLVKSSPETYAVEAKADVEPPETETAQPSAAVSEALSEEHRVILDLLYKIVSKETGYPVGIMEPDLKLKDDLDIDASQKEIILNALITDLEKTFGHQLNPNIHTSRELRVLLDIADLMAEAISRGASIANKSKDDKTETTGPAHLIRRFVLSTRERPLVLSPKPYDTLRTVLVTELAGSPITPSVVDQLKERGCTPIILSHNPEETAADDPRYSLDLTDFAQVESTLAVIREKHGAISGFVHLLPLSTEPAFKDMDMAQWKQQLKLETKSLFYLTKVTANDLAEIAQVGEAGVLAVSTMGGTFASTETWDENPSFFPGQGALSGFLKALSEETPGLNVRVLDMSPDASAETMAARITEEFITPSADIEVGYHDDRRLMLDIKETDLDTKSEELAIDSNSNLLLTGGARGITAAIAVELARRYRPTLFLVGRTPLTETEDAETSGLTDEKQLKAVLTNRLRVQQDKVKPMDVQKAYGRLLGQREIRQVLTELKNAGSKAHYFSVDVTDQDAVNSFLDTIYKDYGKIDGVIHGAGLIEDKMIRDKDIHSFDRVFDTKADSLLILSKALRTDSLRFLALFSSVAGRFGNAGQSDYGAANEVYNKTALYLNNTWPCRVVSFMWGPWESQGGMVSEELKQKFYDNGIYLIPRDVGAGLCVDELVYGSKQDVEVIYGGWDDNKKTVSAAKRADTLPLFFFNSNFNPKLDGTVELVRRIDVNKDVYLQDHKLDGNPVLPMAIALEMMAEAVAYRYTDFHLQSMKKLKVLNGIILKEIPQEHIRISVNPIVKSDTHVSVNVRIYDVHNPRRTYYTAEADLIKENCAPKAHAPVILNESAPFVQTVAEAYKKQLFHGPLWHGIERVETIGKDGIIGHIKASQPSKYIQDASSTINWIVDPLIIDSGMQLVVLWLRHWHNATPLPSQLRKYEQYSPIPAGETVRCEVRIQNGHKGGIKEAEVYFIKPDGNLFGKMEGLEIIGSESLNRLAEK